MAYDFRAQRLFVDMPLQAGAILDPARAQAHYLLNVLRLKAGDISVKVGASGGY